LHAELDGAKFVGRSPRQVEEFIAQVADPIRGRYRAVLGYEAALKV